MKMFRSKNAAGNRTHPRGPGGKFRGKASAVAKKLSGANRRTAKAAARQKETVRLEKNARQREMRQLDTLYRMEARDQGLPEGPYVREQRANYQRNKNKAAS